MEVSMSSVPHRVVHVVSRWLFGSDVTYALLPLLVMRVVMLVAAPRQSESFLSLKEWSFAAIIFFGVSIQRFIHLKVRVQQTPNSFKLDTGVQFFVLLLIIAVLVLTCVVLAERGIFPASVLPLLEMCQMAMFSFGALATLVVSIAENEPQIFSSRFDRSRSSCLKLAEDSLESACEALSRALYWAETSQSAPIKRSADSISDRLKYEDLLAELACASERAELLAVKARELVSSAAVEAKELATTGLKPKGTL
jgi:hypothetical protein